MAEITPATPVESIIYYAGLRDDYEMATSQSQKDEVYADACKIYKTLTFDEDGELVED